MKFCVTHKTHYLYQQPVSLCYNRSHVIPRETLYQHPGNSRISILPVPSSGNRRIDYFGNRSYHFAIDTPHTELSINVVTNISIDPQRNQSVGGLEYGVTCSQVRAALTDNISPIIENLYAREFMLNSPMINASALLADFARPFFTDNRPFLSAVSDLNSAIFNGFKYESGATQVATPIEEVMRHRKGVCQDFAHIAIGCLRSLGFASRYVSGYLETLPPPGQKRLVGADATHAWFAVYSPGEGWFEFDPTNNSTPAEQHIVTAWGRDYSDVSPLRGVVFGGSGKQQLKVSVDVARVIEPGSQQAQQQ